MSSLGHAEAHERLADLALEPGGLELRGHPETDPLAEHVAACATCRNTVEAWRRTHAALEAARGSGADRIPLADLARDEPIAAPAELRAAVLDRIAASPGVRQEQPLVSTKAVMVPQPRASTTGTNWARLPRPALRLLPVAAVLVVVAIGGGVLLDQAGQLDRARQATAALEAVTATVDRILRDPEHRVVDLRSPDGQVLGSLSWSSHDIAVLTTALTKPQAGREYRCWIERDGVRSRVGTMWFAAGTAFWNGSLDEWATTALAAGGTFGVSLEPTDAPGGNPAVLAADLGS